MKLHPLTERNYPDSIVTASNSYYERMIVDCATEYADMIQSAIKKGSNKNDCDFNKITDSLVLSKWKLITSTYRGNKDFNERVFKFLEYYWFIGDLVIPKLRQLKA